jgi:hypothetical protein
MIERFHELMVAMMKKEEDRVDKLEKELITTLNSATEQERKDFLVCLFSAMRLWAYELEKARRLRQALKQFIDDDNTYTYEEDEGESDTFYNYYI